MADFQGIPFDGREGDGGDGGAYSAEKARNEISIPFYKTDNPRRIGFYVKDIVFSGGAMTGILVSGLARAADAVLREDTNKQVDLPDAGTDKIWALVLVNTIGSSAQSYADTGSTMPFKNVIGENQWVPADTLTYRFIAIDTRLVNTIRSTVSIIQWMSTFDAPPMLVSSYQRVIDDIIIDNEIDEPMFNELTVSGILSTTNVASTDNVKADLALYSNDTDLTGTLFLVKIGGVDAYILIGATSIFIRLGELVSDGSGYNAVTYSIVFKRYRNNLIISGEITFHSIPVGNTGVDTSKPALVKNIVGFAKVPRTFKTFYRVLNSSNSSGNSYRPNSYVEVTVR